MRNHRITEPSRRKRILFGPTIRESLKAFYWHCRYCGHVSPGNYPNNQLALEDWQSHRYYDCKNK